MSLKLFRKFWITHILLILGFLVCGPFLVSSFAADSRIGFLDIQKAVSGTKEWKENFGKFKTAFTKEKQRIKLREKKLQKMLENLSKTSFVTKPELKKKRKN